VPRPGGGAWRRYVEEQHEEVEADVEKEVEADLVEAGQRSAA